MAKQTKSYSESIEQIETIIEKIEKGESSIDTLTDDIKQAMELISFCKLRLQSTEAEIAKLLENIENK